MSNIQCQDVSRQHSTRREITIIRGGGIARHGGFESFTAAPALVANGDQFWVSGIKKNGSNAHWAESVSIAIDQDAADEYSKLRK